MSRVSKTKSGLGKSIKNAISKHKAPPKFVQGVQFVHSDLRDQDSKQKQLTSIIDQDNVDDYVNLINMNEEKFSVQRGVQFTNNQTDKEIIIKNDQKVLQSFDIKLDKLRIPRRPKYENGMKKEEFQALEGQAFYEWRKQLALLEQNNYQLHLTPYEKNLSCWRQLWLTIEKSDIIVQVLDGRDPLFYKCDDIETYVKEVDFNKANFLLINKSDLLSEEVRKEWNQYFMQQNIDHMFFSALLEQEKIDNDFDTKILFELHEESNETYTNSYKLATKEIFLGELKKLVKQQRKIKIQKLLLEKNKEELVKNQKILQNPNLVTIGMVGFPNVGKSSVINSLCNKKKVGVASQPGKTKNFQTLFIEQDLQLCDCPGLIFPSASFTRAEMACNGVLQIDKLKDYVSPVQVLCNRIPKQVFKALYGVALQGKEFTSAQLLQQHAIQNKHFTGNNLPDEVKSARTILKDFVSGKLIFCKLPFERDDIWQSNNLSDNQKQGILQDEFTELELQDMQAERELDKNHCEELKLKKTKFLDKFNEEDLEQLMQGKQVKGLKLTKFQRREIKHTYQRGDDIEKMLNQIINGGNTEYGIKSKKL